VKSPRRPNGAAAAEGSLTALQAVWKDYVEAARSFSRPARLYLLAELLAWTGHGVFQVAFNLYLVEAGFQEAFVGRAVSLNALGLALAAWPAGLAAERWGRLRCLLTGAVLEGLGLMLRCLVLEPGVIYGASFAAGMGQSLLAIAAAPFLTEHSTARERTHLFSAFFATALVAGVIGSILGGWIPGLLIAAPSTWRLDLLHAYRVALVVGAVVALCATLPLLRLLGLHEVRHAAGAARLPRGAARPLLPIAVNGLLIGAGAGLVIPFMNLYFARRFQCSSSQIGTFFSIAQVLTAAAALLAPAIARRFGKLRTAVTAQLLSLPFLVTLGAERQLGIAVGAFWLRAMLMQASSPLVQAFVMETLPPALRARASSLTNLVWNVGWAISATFAGALIQRFGYGVPFYVTAALYAIAAVTFYTAFRRRPERGDDVQVSEEAKGQRGEGPFTE
jgi:MFS family permease